MSELKPCPACGSDNVECLVCTINADENQDVHFHIACEACYTSGPIADNGKIAADKWNSLPRRPDYNDVDCAGCPERRRGYLTWTTEPPKVAGWYWRKETAAGRAHVFHFTGNWEDYGEHWESDRVCQLPLILNDNLWAGPIPTPLEPEES